MANPGSIPIGIFDVLEKAENDNHWCRKNWLKQYPDISAQLCFLLQNDDESKKDVKFLLGDGEGVPKEIFSCHSLILRAASTVFSVMLDNAINLPSANENGAIPILDVDSGAFKFMIQVMIYNDMI
jgi:hypothetical protein